MNLARPYLIREIACGRDGRALLDCTPLRFIAFPDHGLANPHMPVREPGSFSSKGEPGTDFEASL